MSSPLAAEGPKPCSFLRTSTIAVCVLAVIAVLATFLSVFDDGGGGSGAAYLLSDPIISSGLVLDHLNPFAFNADDDAKHAFKQSLAKALLSVSDGGQVSNVIASEFTSTRRHVRRHLSTLTQTLVKFDVAVSLSGQSPAANSSRVDQFIAELTAALLTGEIASALAEAAEGTVLADVIVNVEASREEVKESTAAYADGGEEPAEEPTDEESEEEPTADPTAAPTASPTAAPTSSPTAAPTSFPTSSPTSSPTASPTVSPELPPCSSEWTLKGAIQDVKPGDKLTVSVGSAGDDSFLAVQTLAATDGATTAAFEFAGLNHTVSYFLKYEATGYDPALATLVTPPPCASSGAPSRMLRRRLSDASYSYSDSDSGASTVAVTFAATQNITSQDTDSDAAVFRYKWEMDASRAGAAATAHVNEPPQIIFHHSNTSVELPADQVSDWSVAAVSARGARRQKCGWDQLLCAARARRARKRRALMPVFRRENLINSAFRAD